MPSLWGRYMPSVVIYGKSDVVTEAKKRIKSGETFAFSYLDIDNFKAYNDVYGYTRGDKIIKTTAEIISKAVQNYGSYDDFIGHIGGDDFILITGAENIDRISLNILHEFDQIAQYYYNNKDM